MSDELDIAGLMAVHTATSYAQMFARDANNGGNQQSNANYIAQLEQRVKYLEDVNKVLEEKSRIDDDLIEKKDSIIGMQKELLKEHTAEHMTYRKHLEDKLADMESKVVTQSAYFAGFAEIYTVLVKEICEKDDPERYNELNPFKRMRVMKDVCDKYRKSNQLFYHPDLTFEEATDAIIQKKMAKD